MLTKQEIVQLTDKDLKDRINNDSRELLKMRMDLESGFSKGAHKAQQLKKQIAQCKTELTYRTKQSANK